MPSVPLLADCRGGRILKPQELLRIQKLCLRTVEKLDKSYKSIIETRVTGHDSETTSPKLQIPYLLDQGIAAGLLRGVHQHVPRVVRSGHQAVLRFESIVGD